MEQVFLHFETNLAEANKLAEELNEYLKDNYQVDVPIVKKDPNTQDAGSILQIILGAPALALVIKGLADWLMKRNSASITVTKDKEGFKVVAEGVNGTNIKEILTTAEKVETNP
jgi:hypothetical protein